MKAKESPLSPKFKGMEEPIRFLVYGDGSWVSLPEKKSSSAGRVILGPGDGGTSVTIVWKSLKIPRIVRSPLAAETTALADALDEITL